MDIAAMVREKLADDWIPTIYERRVRAERTRSYTLGLGARENQAVIQHTLLGIELKVGRRRLACPDLATARYLRVFARLGLGEVAIPYDITRISTIADDLETAWQKMLLTIDASTANARLRSRVMRLVRDEMLAIGSGPAMPTFDRATRDTGR